MKIRIYSLMTDTDNFRGVELFTVAERRDAELRNGLLYFVDYLSNPDDVGKAKTLEDVRELHELVRPILDMKGCYFQRDSHVLDVRGAERVP